MNGTVSEGVIAAILREIYVGRGSGILHFTQGEERRSVRFHKGNIVHGDTNVKEERLGEILVKQGLLSSADLKRATGFVLRDKKRLGQVLQELQILDKDKLEDALALHAREILLRVFTWTEGEYVFEEDPPETGIPHDTTLKLSTGEMILEAARRVEDPDVLRYALGNLDRVLGLTTDPLLRFQRVTLSPADGYVLSRVDGSLSAREIIQMNTAPADETMRSLYGLLCTGIIEYLPVPPKPALKPEPRRPPEAEAPPAPEAPPASAEAPAVVAPAARMEEPAPPAEEADPRRQEILEAYEGIKVKTHFEVLGIPKASNEAQVKDAYFRLAKRFHPDSHHDPALADLADKLEAVFIRLGEAYEVLRNPTSRSSYESDLAYVRSRQPQAPGVPGDAGPPAAPDPEYEARLAEQSFKKAERYYEHESYWDAIQLLEPALTNALGKTKDRIRVLLAKCYAKNPKWVKRAEEQLQSVIKDDPANGEAHFLLGMIYRDGGLRHRAIASFQRVLELKPDFEPAAAELASLSPPEGERQGGLLKKLFRKT
ncbi:MAG TPA: DUF4388 domain-containing protein [Vicinamibacteria bacterium]|jgi:curved DNA-binding protein CbpA